MRLVGTCRGSFHGFFPLHSAASRPLPWLLAAGELREFKKLSSNIDRVERETLSCVACIFQKHDK